jgi:hypothetical protein
MNVKRFLLAVTAVAMFAAVMASSASATMTASGQWYTGGSGTPLAGSKTVTCSVGEHEGSSAFALIGGVGETKTPVRLTATGIECLSWTIFNESSHGKAKGKLKFTGVTVDEPAGCEIEGKAIETTELKAELYMDSESSTKAFDKFEPAAGPTNNFATIKLIGASCPVTGSKLVKGTFFGEATNPTSTSATTQSLTFSAAIDATAGGALTLAGNEAHLTGRVNNKLSPEEAFEAH